MKYISLLIVLGFLIFTWKVSTSKKDLTLSEQQRLNEVISEFVTKAVQEKVPNATDIQFSKLYTEVLEPGEKMRAHFSFSYLENTEAPKPSPTGLIQDMPLPKEDLRRYRKGSFFITSKDGNQWNAKIEKIDDIKIEFVEPLDMSKDYSVEASPEPKPAETKSEPTSTPESKPEGH